MVRGGGGSRTRSPLKGSAVSSPASVRVQRLRPRPGSELGSEPLSTTGDPDGTTSPPHPNLAPNPLSPDPLPSRLRPSSNAPLPPPRPPNHLPDRRSPRARTLYPPHSPLPDPSRPDSTRIDVVLLPKGRSKGVGGGRSRLQC